MTYIKPNISIIFLEDEDVISSSVTGPLENIPDIGTGGTIDGND